MKITKQPNPLATVVELDENEKKLLWYKLKLEWMEDAMYGAYFNLTSRLKDQPGLPAMTVEAAIEESVRELDPDYWCGDEGKAPLDTNTDKMLEYYLDELRSIHSGDCTAFPASCGKCHAERLLGFSTLPQFSKGINHSLYHAFISFEGMQLTRHTLEEAQARLDAREDDLGKKAAEILRSHTADLQH